MINVFKVFLGMIVLGCVGYAASALVLFRLLQIDSPEESFSAYNWG